MAWTKALMLDRWWRGEWPDVVEVLHEGEAGGRRYVPERTCSMTKNGRDKVLAGWWECSECGPVFPPCTDEVARWALRYCPRCGARVVEEGR